MKLMFIEARKRLEEENQEQIKQYIGEFIKKFPKIKNIGILAAIQYIDFLPLVKEELEKANKKVFFSKGKTAKYSSQVLGCDAGAAKNIEDKVDAFLLLSTGRFHAVQLSARKPVFILNESGFSSVNEEELRNLKNKRDAAIKKFLASNEIGILISAKSGQQNMKNALKIKKKLEKKGKKAFLFVADTINIYELENFPCSSFINTACPALSLDSAKIVNFNEIEKFLASKKQCATTP